MSSNMTYALQRRLSCKAEYMRNSDGRHYDDGRPRKNPPVACPIQKAVAEKMAAFRRRGFLIEECAKRLGLVKE